MATYSDWDQRQMDIESGKDADRATAMQKVPAPHYHRIETADIQAAMSAIDKKEKQINQDVEYNLARLEGQLERMRTIIYNGGSPLPWGIITELSETLTNAKSFLSALRKSLDGNRYDVT